MASILFPHRGWATDKKKPSQHIEKGGVQTNDPLRSEPFSPARRWDTQVLHQKGKSQCPGGKFTDVDGIIYCVPQLQGRPGDSHFPRGPSENITRLSPKPWISDSAPRISGIV